jgi:hypothetical protein
MYILCFAQKDVLRGGFGPSQSGAKGLFRKLDCVVGGICVYTVDG